SNTSHPTQPNGTHPTQGGSLCTVCRAEPRCWILPNIHRSDHSSAFPCPCLSHLQGLAGHSGFHSSRYPTATYALEALARDQAVIRIYLMTSCTSGFDDDARIPRQVYVNGLQCLKELVAPTPFPASTVMPPGPDMPPTATAQHHATPSHPLRLRTIAKTLPNAVNELVQPMPGSSRFHN
ncbi:hypothetical protein CCUS01_14966, partial [Colletotrichum cuscutae]